MNLPREFLDRPIAHRGLHGGGRPENSRASILAAISEGYGIEIDVQLTADDKALVFHDYELSRLTEATGAVRQRRSDELLTIPLSENGEGLPCLAEVLGLVAGQVPLLIELKDSDGALGEDVGQLEAAVAGALSDYSGPVAVMSFNPHSVAALQVLLPEKPRGLVTDAFSETSWPVPAARLAELRSIPDYARVGASFISHDHKDLAAPRVAELKAEGASILCWTTRSPEEEAKAREIAHNVTFEGYLP